MKTSQVVLISALLALCTMSFNSKNLDDQGVDCGYRESNWKIVAQVPGVSVTFENTKNHQTMTVDAAYYACINDVATRICELENLKRQGKLSKTDKEMLSALYRKEVNMIIKYEPNNLPMTYYSSNERGQEYAQIEIIKSSNYCNPCKGYQFSKTITLNDNDGLITCVDYTCVGAACAWSFNPQSGGDHCEGPGKPSSCPEFEDRHYCAGADRRCDYCGNFSVIKPGNAVLLRRKWDVGTPVEERYVIYYKRPRLDCSKLSE